MAAENNVWEIVTALATATGTIFLLGSALKKWAWPALHLDFTIEGALRTDSVLNRKVLVCTMHARNYTGKPAVISSRRPLHGFEIAAITTGTTMGWDKPGFGSKLSYEQKIDPEGPTSLQPNFVLRPLGAANWDECEIEITIGHAPTRKGRPTIRVRPVITSAI